MKKLFSFFLLFSCLVISVYAQDGTIHVKGTVFIDENGNRKLDSGEEGKEGVLLSNGKKVIESGSGGIYEIEIRAGQLVFPILPNGFKHSKKPRWWFNSNDLDNPSGTKQVEDINFGLSKELTTKELKLLAIGDVQVENREELDYASRTIFAELMDQTDYDFSIFMGDLVNDNPDLMAPVKEMMDALHKPAWTIYGNHDRNFKAAQKEQSISYNKYYGPENYAFIKNDILFIGLNSIYPKGKFGYEGRYTDKELHFLDNILKSVSGEQLIVINQHIPFGWMKNRAALTEKLEGQGQVLVLSAHAHITFQNFFNTEGDFIHELNVGATSGHWWTGQQNWEGNPLSLMKDGTPRGYFEIRFLEGDYNITYKGVGLDKDKQMTIWMGKNNEHITQVVDSTQRDIFVNVFAGSERTDVNIKIDDGRWLELAKTEEVDPYVNRIDELQDKDLYPNKVSKKSPYRESPSDHLWKGQVPANIGPGMHKLEVAATDSFGLHIKTSRWFWVE